MNVVSNSVGLMRQSWNVLRTDKELVVFPLLSAASGILVLATFIAPLALLLPWQQIAKGGPKDVQVQLTFAHYSLMLGFYVVNFTVMSFFNTALAACVLERFRGGNPTVRFGISVAVARLHHIVGWAFLAATVGMIIKAIQERVGLVGKIVTALIGVAWTIASYFVVPVLVAENMGPIDALKRSGQLMSRTWGTALVSNMGMGLVGFLVSLLCLLPMGAGIVMLVMGLTGNNAGNNISLPLVVPGVLCIGLSILLLMAWSLIGTTLRSILNTALYHFAVNGAAPQGFDEASMRTAFRTKKK